MKPENVRSIAKSRGIHPPRKTFKNLFDQIAPSQTIGLDCFDAAKAAKRAVLSVKAVSGIEGEQS